MTAGSPADVEIWFASPPPVAAIAMALERFGTLHELPAGELRLVEGDEAARDGVPLWFDEEAEEAEAPGSVRALLERPRAVLRASCVLSGSRGFWMVRVAAEILKRLGGVVHLPLSGETYGDADGFEASWPREHGGHGGPGGHGGRSQP